MLVECSFPDESPVQGHMTPAAVARMASESGVRQIVLTHIYPAADALDLPAEVGRGYNGEVVVAQDGSKLSVLNNSRNNDPSKNLE
jgi:ribonuclease BN (tRNA processing enzyme)